MPRKANYASKSILRENIAIAQRQKKAELVIKDVRFLDVFNGRFERGDVAIANSVFVGIKDQYSGHIEIDGGDYDLVPGFIDTHVHIESSLMTPARFEESVLPCATTTAIWDPHEIANVKGVEGIKWAIREAKKCVMDLFVMIPSCVPATSSELGLESSGASLLARDLHEFIHDKQVLGLAEMMNFPGLLAGEDDVIDKLWDYRSLARDGHCPNLSGHELNAYGVAGIHSCHESTNLEEAREKLLKGIKVLIREGSCAKNTLDLLPLINAYSSAVLCLCSDDRNSYDIAKEGHIDHIVRLALAEGVAAEDIFRIASFSAAQAFDLSDRGAIAPGFIADFSLIKRKSKDWRDGFSIEKVFKAGKDLATLEFQESSQLPNGMTENNMNMAEFADHDLAIRVDCAKPTEQFSVRVIEVIPNQIVTRAGSAHLSHRDGELKPELKDDILPIAVIERHQASGRIGLGFTKGFALEKGAIACSVTHDSHNAIGVGANKESLAAAFRELKRINGGIVVWAGPGICETLALPIGGLMTNSSPQSVTQALTRLKALAASLGCTLDEPFLQLSFLSLPVIGALRITDRGLVDVSRFSIVDTII